MQQRLAKPLTALFAVLTGSVNALAGDSFSLSATSSDGVKTESSHDGAATDDTAKKDSAAAADSSAAADSDAASNEEVYQAPLELGVFTGMFMPSATHNLMSRTYEPFRKINPEIGGHAALYPWQFLGGELEGAVMFSKTAVTHQSATLWALRAQLIGQIPSKVLTPFVLAGVGLLHAGSDVTGSDTDPALHLGVGLKLALSDTWSLRTDLRNNMSQRHADHQGKMAQHPEFQIGLAMGIGKPEKVVVPPPPLDTDKDGIIDERDLCRDVPGPAPDGCPDTDGDGFFDNKDDCPTVPGIAPRGCPPGDRDKDGFTDDVDKCPDVPGTIEGCPDPDPDRDGILGAADKCPEIAETANGYEDEDGCPDVVPEKIKKFTGVIKGIEFDVNTDHIRKGSTGVIDAAVAVLAEFPALRVMISGHTDTDGTKELNMTLSANRAASVKAYMVKKGIADDRIETRGAGFDEPIAENSTAEGKQKNRRIEFKLIEGAAAKAASDANAASAAEGAAPSGDAKPADAKPVAPAGDSKPAGDAKPATP